MVIELKNDRKNMVEVRCFPEETTLRGEKKSCALTNAPEPP